MPRSLLLHLTGKPDGSATPADRHAWLGQCEGFQVIVPNGRVGTVREIIPSIIEDGIPTLLVTTGLFRLREVQIGAEAVERIDPFHGRIGLWFDPFVGASEVLDLHAGRSA